MGTSTAEGTEVFTEVAARADDARCWWVDHLAQPVPPDERWGPSTESWAGRVITWFGDDLARWTALDAWATAPHEPSARRTFLTTVPAPPIDGHPVRDRIGLVGPAPDASEADLLAWLSDLVATARTTASVALRHAVDAAAARDAGQLATVLRDEAPTLAHRWDHLAIWARRPTVTGPASTPSSPRLLAAQAAHDRMVGGWRALQARTTTT